MTDRISLRFFALTLMLVAIVGLGWTASAWAMSLQDAKAQGLLGEQPNGYLGLVKSNASPEVKALMNNINAQRKQEYRSIAKRNNTKLNVVEALAGKKAMERTPPGQYIRSPSGQWSKK
jgi:uncharacterized protein YdbL (DUF1318 family)